MSAFPEAVGLPLQPRFEGAFLSGGSRNGELSPLMPLIGAVDAPLTSGLFPGQLFFLLFKSFFQLEALFSLNFLHLRYLFTMYFCQKLKSWYNKLYHFTKKKKVFRVVRF